MRQKTGISVKVSPGCDHDAIESIKALANAFADKLGTKIDRLPWNTLAAIGDRAVELQAEVLRLTTLRPVAEYDERSDELVCWHFPNGRRVFLTDFPAARNRCLGWTPLPKVVLPC